MSDAKDWSALWSRTSQGEGRRVGGFVLATFSVLSEFPFDSCTRLCGPRFVGWGSCTLIAQEPRTTFGRSRVLTVLPGARVESGLYVSRMSGDTLPRFRLSGGFGVLCRGRFGGPREQ